MEEAFILNKGDKDTYHEMYRHYKEQKARRGERTGEPDQIGELPADLMVLLTEDLARATSMWTNRSKANGIVIGVHPATKHWYMTDHEIEVSNCWENIAIEAGSLIMTKFMLGERIFAGGDCPNEESSASIYFGYDEAGVGASE